MPLTTPPIGPSTLDPATFAPRMDARLAWQDVNVTEMNVALPIVDAAVVATAASAADAAAQVALAAAQAAAATASAAAATLAAGIAVWASGTYAANAPAISGIDRQVYRNKTAGSRTVDPKNDPTNWVRQGALVSMTGNSGRALTNDGSTESWGPYLGVRAANIASASTLNLTSAAGDSAHITGTTTVTAITLADGVEFTTIFDGALTLTNSASLILLGNANIVTAAGDVARWVGDGANVRMLGFARSTGGAVSPATAAEVKTGAITSKEVTPASMLGALGFSAYAQTADQTMTSGGALTIAHGLSRTPVLVFGFLKCVTAESSYSVGDIVPVSIGANSGAATSSVAVTMDATNLYLRFTSGATIFSLPEKSSGVTVSASTTGWKFFVRALA